MAVAGAITFTPPDTVGRPVRRYVFDWTSSAGGAVTDIVSPNRISGQIARITIKPDGTDVPTALYDATLLDDEGVDVMGGQGANLSATVTTSFVPGVPLNDGTTVSVSPIYIDDFLTLTIAAAGASKKGRVVVYMIGRN